MFRRVLKLFFADIPALTAGGLTGWSVQGTQQFYDGLRLRIMELALEEARPFCGCGGGLRLFGHGRGIRRQVLRAEVPRATRVRMMYWGFHELVGWVWVCASAKEAFIGASVRVD